METDVPIDTSSVSTPPVVTPTERLERASESERLTWRKTGDLPTPSADQPAASATATPDSQAASTDASPKPPSEAAKPAKNADTRVQELLADRAAERSRAERLERELSDLRRSQQPPAADAKSAASSTATSDVFPEYPDYLETHPDATLGQYLSARDDWRDEKRDARVRADTQQQHEQRWHTERLTTFSAQIQTAKQADPGFADKLSPDVAALEPVAIAVAAGRPITIDNAIAEEILDSPVAGPLMLHLSAHPEDMQSLRGARTARELARRVGALERGLSSAAPTASSIKTVSEAPDPPTYVGTRTGGPVDAVEAAVKRKDAGAYMREANALELAARR